MPSRDAAHSFLASVERVLNYPVPLGAAHITLLGILQLAGLCALVLVIERLLRRRVVMRVLNRTRLDAGLQYAIARISGYLVIALGFYLALNTVGINLNSLAFVAGAIGIGIGFGLQNIIQNFISGIIILAERPITLGDRVEVGGVAGTVSKISLRSTEIVSNDNIATIVPNSNFITNPVTNWSHGDPKVRIRIPFGVAYGSDIEKLKRVAREAAEECPSALKDPEPKLFFVGFGDSSLNFELGVWTVSMTHAPRSFISELNFALERRLRAANIEIPFPQRDLNIRHGKISAGA